MPDYDPTTALIVVDVQNDFVDPGGSLAVAGAVEVVPFINEQIERARAAGAVIAYTQDWHPPDTPHFAKDGGVWPVHCVAGTWGAEFHPSLTVVEESERIRKGSNGEDGYSGFTMRDPESGEEIPTGLDARLRERGVTRAAVVGIATDYCVKGTVLDAVAAGFETIVLRDGMAAVNLEPTDGEAALDAMAAAGATIR